MQARTFLAAALLAASPAFAASPTIPAWDAAALTRACEGSLDKARKTVAAMGSRSGPVFDEWNRLEIDLEDVFGPISLLGNVHPDKAVRDAAEPCLAKYTTFSTELFQDEKLFARVNASVAKGAHQEKLKKDLIEGFEDSGVALPPDKRARVKEIFEKLEALRQAFDRNIRDDPTKVTVLPAEMAGMPDSYLEGKKKDDKGNYVLGLDSPTYQPFMQNARSGAARERYYRAKFNEGGLPNLKLLEEMFTLRKELAALYGLPTYAHYGVRRKMVRTPEVVNKFLADVKAAVIEAEKKEAEELRGEKAKDLRTPLSDTRLNRWDVAYYQEKVKKARFSIDQEALRKYFPTDKALAFTFLVSEKLYGVKFKEKKVAAWHPDVRYFDVTDAKSGKYISSFYLDLFPRDGKFNHAAAWPVRGVSRVANRTPMSVLVTNFDRKGLDHREMEVLMHEFGHVLHGVLSTADYNHHAGTATVQDFVEAPSQMLEEWVRREQSLALMKQVCPKCPQLSSDQIARLESARKYSQGGIYYSRQWQYAYFDMTLSQEPQPPLDLWKKIENESPLGHVDGTIFPAAFSHIASNYAAGYYGYMYSQVIALDMLSAYKDNLMDPKVGRRYRDTILAHGGEEEAMELVKRFLGREPSSEAFFKEITGKR
jgi:thimet oligopeptidase